MIIINNLAETASLLSLPLKVEVSVCVYHIVFVRNDYTLTDILTGANLLTQKGNTSMYVIRCADSSTWLIMH